MVDNYKRGSLVGNPLVWALLGTSPLRWGTKKNKKRAYGLSLGLYSLKGLIRWLGVAVHFLMQMAYIFPKWANSRLDIRAHGLELGSEPE